VRTRRGQHLVAPLYGDTEMRGGSADTFYALATNESVFLRLTRECGWTPDRYADLIAHALKASLGAK
jgi:hypothetical protein